jgi:hypothetical protein
MWTPLSQILTFSNDFEMMRAAEDACSMPCVSSGKLNLGAVRADYIAYNNDRIAGKETRERAAS